MIGDMSKDDENELWAFVTKDVKKLTAPDKNVPELRRRRLRLNPFARMSPPPAVTAPQGGGLDRNTEEKVRKGQMAIEARLDLHGRTLDRAREDLLRFVQSSFTQGMRGLLVITGKGRSTRDSWFAPGEGAIKREFPLWLEDPAIKSYILSVSQARNQHGGSGAWYVYLRKNRAGSN